MSLHHSCIDTIVNNYLPRIWCRWGGNGTFCNFMPSDQSTMPLEHSPQSALANVCVPKYLVDGGPSPWARSFPANAHCSHWSLWRQRKRSSVLKRSTVWSVIWNSFRFSAPGNEIYIFFFKKKRKQSVAKYVQRLLQSESGKINLFRHLELRHGSANVTEYVTRREHRSHH